MSTTLFKSTLLSLLTFAGAAHADQNVTFGMTTTQEASGIASAILGEMKLNFPTYDLSYSIAGTSQQLRSLKEGFLPFGITHNAAKEHALVAEGQHVREVLFSNDFLFVGPENSSIKCDLISDCLTAVVDSEEVFLSRGDQSGTHAYELTQWERAAVDPTQMHNYEVSSGGTANSLRICGIRDCHVIVDESSFSPRQRNGLVEIARDKGTNIYSLIYSKEFGQSDAKDIIAWAANEVPKLSEKFGYRKP